MKTPAASLALCLAALGGAASASSASLSTSPSDCFGVTYLGSVYYEGSSKTVFSYSVQSSATPGCPSIRGWHLSGNCPSTCPEATASLEGWTWRHSQALGSSFKYEVHVDGRVGATMPGEFQIKTSSPGEVFSGPVAVPDCQAEEPTLPNVGEPCELVVPESLTLPSTGKAQLQVSLQAQPDGEVTVVLASDCAFLDRCALVFDPSNWNVPQAVGVGSNPANPANSCSVTLSATGTNDCEGTVSVAKPPAPKTESVSYGDPYIFTFDAVRYQLTQTTSGDDYYYLLRQPNGELIVQTFVQPCAIGECNAGAAIRYRTAFYELLMGSDGTLTPAGSANLAAEGVSVSNPSSNSVLLELNTQAAIRLTAEPIPSMSIFSLRVSIRLGEGYEGNVAGLVGNFNGNKNDERRLPDGTQAATLALFENGWKVPAGENLFSNPSATIGTLYGAQPYTFQTFPFVCESD